MKRQTDFFYNDGNYSYTSILSEDYAEYNNIHAAGQYGGDISNWWMSLDESSLVWEESSIGSAVGTLYATFEETGSVKLDVQAFDDVDSEQLVLSSVVNWSSPSSWESAGDVDLTTTIKSLDFDRLFSLDFTYGDNAYSGESMLSDSNGVLFNQIFGNGKYGGPPSDW